MKNMARKDKKAIKKRVFWGKKNGNGLEKLRAGNQNRKAKWYKMQVLL